MLPQSRFPQTGHRLALLLLVLGMGSLLGLEALSPQTLWIDEIHSLQLSQLPLVRILDESAADFHPPGYPLALKAWIKLPRALGLEPGLRWARTLNLVVWALSAAAAGVLGRHYFGSPRNLLVLLAAFGGPAAATVVADVRSYGFAYCALALAALIMPLAATAHARRRTVVVRWLAYAALLGLALWSHLMAAIAVAYLTLAWWTMGVRDTPSATRGSRALGGAAHVLPWVIYLPWLLRVPGQVERLQAAAPDWMTPPTLGNLARVFYWWIPYGRASILSPQGYRVLAVLAGIALLLPVAFALRRGKALGGATPQRLLVNTSLLVATGSIMTGWLVARLGVAATFHGPRYPLVVAGMLLVGVAGAACAGGRTWWACGAALAPLVLAAALGHALLAPQRAASAGFPHLEREVIDRLAQTSQSVFLSPAELIPFVRDSLPALTLAPAHRFPCDFSPPLAVLDVNPWKSLARPRDLLLMHLVGTPSEGVSAARHPFRDDRITATLYVVDGLDPVLAAALCQRELAPAPSAPPAGATATAEDQLSGDGFSYLEFSGDGAARRWSTAPTVVMRFDRELPAGPYVLHFRGARASYPAAAVVMSFEMPGSDLDRPISVGAGEIALDLPLVLRGRRRPQLLVDHPLWSPADELGSRDPRLLGFQLHTAWITRGEPHPDP